MDKLISFCRRGKLLGLLGLPVFFSDLAIFKLFWLFWLLGIVEIVLSPGILGQSLKQIWGMIAVPIKYGKNVPSTQNFSSEKEYSLPFAGSWDVVNGGVTKEFSHSWDIPTQRYAYDFLIIGEDMKTFSGAVNEPKSYFCYGREILAAADGEVVEIRDKFKDTRILGGGKLDYSTRDICGNTIAIKHGEKEYSFYAHLVKGSIKVKVGEQVKKGQALALCGNTGNSSEPHLHFQLQDGKCPYTSAGLPIVFSHVARSEAAGYEKYDARKIPPIDDKFIARGQRVGNT